MLPFKLLGLGWVQSIERYFAAGSGEVPVRSILDEVG
jgi:hypothetical protein